MTSWYAGQRMYVTVQPLSAFHAILAGGRRDEIADNCGTCLKLAVSLL
jgi:hypothetical protein